jgi:hypothetical protein
MGLTFHDVRRLFEARKQGHAFRDVLSFAHQRLFLHPSELEALRRSYREFTGARVAPLRDYHFGEYADRFFAEFLGVEKVETLDYSDYEGASLVHDMNTPVDESLHQRFDTVIEAGSLEHVFQFPVAIRNLMMMAKTGGRIFMTTVANNLCGHGFYQFSPELIFRIFSPENGFERPKVALLEGTFPWIEMSPARAIYEVVDPIEVHGRVGLQTSSPVMMMVDTHKIRHVEPFRENPQQSDYVATWQASSKSQAASPRSLVRQVLYALPSEWQNRLRGHRSKRDCSFRNARFYRRLN